jgi:hypothetical protein
VDAFTADPVNAHLSLEERGKLIDQIQYAVPFDVCLPESANTF